MALLKQSTARNRVILLVQSADHVTGLAGATLTITVSKNGNAFASTSPVVTDLGNGFYELALTTTDTNTLGDLAFHITAASADPTDFIDQVVADLPGATVSTVTGDLSATAKASVKAQVDASLATDTIAELAAPPAATPTLEQAIMFLYMALRNKLTTTAALLTVANDAGTTIAKSTVSDDATTFTRDKFVAGP